MSDDTSGRLEQAEEVIRIGKSNLARAARIEAKLRDEIDKWKASAYAWAPMGTCKGWDREEAEAKAAALRHTGCGEMWIWDNGLGGRCGREGLCTGCASVAAAERELDQESQRE